MSPGLTHVYWIGGGSGAGKSTIARRIAERHGLALYDTDAMMRDHDARMAPRDAPLLTRFKAMSMNERWALRTPTVMLDTFHWFAREGFPLITEDLSRAPRATVAEGFRLLPDLVAPLLTDRRGAVWLLPTPAFRRAAFDQRGTTWEIANATTNPDLALHNLLERDAMFTEALRADLHRLELPAIDVELGMTEDDSSSLVASRFGLSADGEASP